MRRPRMRMPDVVTLIVMVLCILFLVGVAAIIMVAPPR